MTTEWISDPLPLEIERLPAQQQLDVRNRFAGAFDFRPTPLDVPGGGQYGMLWPGAQYETRLLPGGVNLCAEEMPRFETSSTELLSGVSCKEFYYFGPDFPDTGVYRGPFNVEVAWWIKGQLIVSPTIVISADQQFLLISEESWDVSVLGGSTKVVAKFDEAAGGVAAIREKFELYAASGFVGVGGDLGNEWAQKYPISWCSW